MSDPVIDFDWQRDAAGYRLAGPEPAKRGETLLTGNPARPLRVVGCSGKLVPIRPLERSGDRRLYVAFAGVDNAEALLAFIGLHGPLTRAGLGSGGQEVAGALEHAGVMRKVIQA